ncbi:MAG TPA: type 2 isopentenyl-diphosphate Delta-isomerase [Acidimicrobiia bacterium]|nr:type 2 isopentenyl-diphosphate Delta-isomerase [Acidimicrobiia bacterium]
MSMISNRKREHIDAALGDRSQSAASAGWEDVHLVPAALPEVDAHSLDLGVTLGGHRLAAPLVIVSMTGGHEQSVSINQSLAVAAETHGIAIGSGSQRAALREPALVRSYTVIRESAPTALVIANLGVCQLVPQGEDPPLSRSEVEEALGMLDAQVLAIHLNVVEEMIQPEGDRNFLGLLDAIGELVDWSPVPVMVKETGAGMSRETASQLASAGVSILDVGGAGGTSFARIEGERAKAVDDAVGARLGGTFEDWGIPTAMSILETRTKVPEVVATGGVRSGLDVAKALALGATAAGVGRPVLAAAIEGTDSAVREVEILLAELRLAMTLVGSGNIAALREAGAVLTGNVASWAAQRGLL